MPFTSAARVPVPKLEDAANNPAGKGKKKRVVSQMAKVFRSASTERRFAQEGGEAGGDELSVGIEYVRALGGDLNANASGSNGACLSLTVDVGYGG